MDYTIRRSTKAKRMRLTLSAAGELTLVLPRFVPEIAGKAFLASQKKWVERQRAKIKPPVKIYSQSDFVSGSVLSFFDQKKYSIKIAPHKLLYDKFFLEETTLYIKLSTQKKEPKQKRVKLLIEKFYREQAAFYLTDRSHFWADRLGEKFNKVTIKNTRSRWGSCSTQKNLNYNWRIMLAPKAVVDYLVIHEVCHLKQMNHSSKFWSLVEGLDPSFKAHKNYLKEHQDRLFNFLV